MKKVIDNKRAIRYQRKKGMGNPVFAVLVLVLCSLLLVGCTSQTSVTTQKNQTTEISKSDGNELNNSLKSETKVNGSVIVENKSNQTNSTVIEVSNNITIAENKTGQEKVQEVIASVVPDGTYTDDVTYAYHSGTERITISITLKNDVITGASITPHDPKPTSANFISKVNAALPDLVIGKKITELNLPHQISGSSLTSGAFRAYAQGIVDKNKKQ
ncbi:hypothetical protein HY988_04420 [Candidatus Micrarchaeota archaeon]|nr:hypothetical protein [Candidatus Micrarchaeota archaeon]